MYNIEELAAITGFTTRTLRSALREGTLKGEKEEGRWMFSEEDVAAFMAHPSVQPGIRAKRQGIVCDFQTGNGNAPNEMCVLLDLSEDRETAGQRAEFFCGEAGKSHHIRFRFDYEKQTAHYVLKGEESEIRGILSRYGQMFGDEQENDAEKKGLTD